MLPSGMCASVFYSVTVLRGQIFVELALFLAKIVVPVSFTGLGGVYSGLAHFIPGGVIWARTDYTRVKLVGGVNLGCYTGTYEILTLCTHTYIYVCKKYSAEDLFPITVYSECLLT